MLMKQDDNDIHSSGNEADKKKNTKTETDRETHRIIGEVKQYILKYQKRAQNNI